MAEILLHAWLIPSVFLCGRAGGLNSWSDLWRIAALTLGWPVAIPTFWLVNRITR